MTATMIDEKTNQEIFNYRPPTAKLGDRVLWYPDWATPETIKEYPDSLECHVAFVTGIQPRQITLIVPDLRMEKITGVPYFEDPRPFHKESYRQNGMWSFTESDDPNLSLEKRVKKLEFAVGSLSKQLKGDDDNASG